MKVVIIGGVAAGPKIASKVIRNNPDADVTVIEKGKFLSYAGCGLPYYVSGEVETQEELMATPVGTVRDSVFFQNVKNVRVLNKTEAVDVSVDTKTVKTINSDGEESIIEYDKLVFATGASPVKPPFPGLELDNIFTLSTVENAENIKQLLAQHKALDTVIIGGGLIGIEMAEALISCGCRVTIVEKLPHILPMLDEDMIVLVEKYLESKGVKVMTNTTVLGFAGEGALKQVQTDKGDLNAELAILSIGVRPTVELAKKAGVELGETGAIKVNEQMMTSNPDIYAAGDCVEVKHIVTDKPCYIPLGSTANKQGRVAANSICGIKDAFTGVAGSSVCKIFDFTTARTGLGFEQAKAAGFDPVYALAPAPDKAHFMKSARPLMLKLIADRKTRKVLGAQAIGLGTGDKRIDVVATALATGMTVDQLANVDLVYAPPYSPAVDNILTAANVLRNKLDGAMTGISSKEVKAKLDNGDDMILLDVRSPKELEAMKISEAINIPLGKLRSSLDQLDKSKEIIAFCKISLRGYEAALILKNAGFKNVKVMDGGILMWPYKK